MTASDATRDATPPDFSTILIANRGEIALRIVRTARRLGYRTIAVYSAADRDAPHVRSADDAVALDATHASEPYLNVDAVVAAARASGADAIHPGYGFLSERPDFAERCENERLVFIGPSAASMRALGDKARAKRLLADRGVAFLPGYFGTEQDDATLLAAAHATGFPLMIKAAAGGGGRGMRLVIGPSEFRSALEAARREARAAFGDATLLFERALVAPRHVEVQIVGDRFGNVVHLGERDCSVQRRFQKLIEESPSPAVDDTLRTRLGATAVAVARAAQYAGAGTIEFLLDLDGAFYFIEANARLQVEHPVTEAVSGIDLVEWQLRVARGEPLPLAQHEIHIVGHAIEARLCAEDAASGFLPQSGTLVRWQAPDTIRVDHALESGCAISRSYDSMIAKLIAHGPTRDDARRTLARALEQTIALGVTTNAAFLIAALRDQTFVAGEATTAFVDEMRARIPTEAEAIAVDTEAMHARAIVAVLRARSTAREAGFGGWSDWSSNARPPSAVHLEALEDGARTLVHLDAHAHSQAVDTIDATARVVATIDATPHVVATIDAAKYVVAAATGAGRLHVHVDGRFYDTAYAEAGDRLYIALGARTFAFQDLSAVPAAARKTASRDGSLRAPMTGHVIDVRVRPGETVAAETVAVVLEAMKMEHAVTIPFATTIATVEIAKDGHVSAGDVLVTYVAGTNSACSTSR